MLETLLYKHINIKIKQSIYLLPYILSHPTLTYKIIQGIEQVTKTCQGSIIRYNICIWQVTKS
jgi:hypothetical protein